MDRAGEQGRDSKVLTWQYRGEGGVSVITVHTVKWLRIGLELVFESVNCDIQGYYTYNR